MRRERVKPPDRRLFTSPLLTELTSSVQDHPCRVCGGTIMAGTDARYRAWHLEYAHAACGWLRVEEFPVHVRRKPGSFTDYYEWRCPTCGLDACSSREPDGESERRCSRCAPEQHAIADGCRVELVIGFFVRDGRRRVKIPSRTRGYVRELAAGDDGMRAVVEWIGIRAPRCSIDPTMLVRV